MSQIAKLLIDDTFTSQLKTRIVSGKDALRFSKMFQSAVYKTPKLLQCTPESIKIAAYTLAELDLSPIPTHGQAYLIPYGGKNGKPMECQLQIGYRGYINLALRDGNVKSINAQLVYKGENFVCHKGTVNKIEHEIDYCNDIDKSVENIRGGYACAELASGGHIIEVMSIQELEEHKKRYMKPSYTGKPGPWETSPEEMMRKTLVKRLCKYLPMLNNYLTKALEIDNEAAEKCIDGEAQVVNTMDAIKAELGIDPTVEEFFNDEETLENERDINNGN